MLAASLVLASPTRFTPTSDANMNGDYLLSRTPGAPAGRDFPTAYKDYPGGVEYFEVYHGPLKTTYSQVWWTSTANALPDEFVQRFDGKAIAIVGLEMDQVRRTPHGDVRVPITMSYNHHHDTAVVGKRSELVEVPRDSAAFRAAGRDYIRLDGMKAWVAKEHTRSTSGLPSSAMFSDGNGGEYRKSFHAYAPPFAQIVESPTQLAGAPMQIDTWHRGAMNISGGSPFVPGPVPKATLAPLVGPDATYSGLLECPLTTRIRKVYGPASAGFNTTYEGRVFACSHTPTTPQTCDHPIGASATCFAAAAKLAGLEHAHLSTATTHDDTAPPGCSISAVRAGAATVTFNTNSASAVCCGTGPSAEVEGSVASLVSLTAALSGRTSVATLTLAGPADVWFGVGFGASEMAAQPYAIVVGGNGTVSERKLGNHAAGTMLSPSVTVVSNTVSAGTRTVVLTRRLGGATHDHFSFNATSLSLPIINAVGAGAAFAQHKAATAAMVALWPTDAAASTCVCAVPPAPFGQGSGALKYLPTGESVGFPPNRCAHAPRETVLDDRNPTCDLRTYSGGLVACHHGWHLLDADQDIPWADQPLELYKKFRIYYQPYNASFHQQILREDWGIAADGDHSEYDVPQGQHSRSTCADQPVAAGLPVQCNHTIEGAWVPIPASRPNLHLVAVHHHCHAPTCLVMELWNNDTGKLLCRQTPVHGRDRMGTVDYDEKGYIATPPCLFGSPEHGLEPPPLMSGVTVKVVAVTNSTYGHHGEMALPEVALVQM